eukprot:CAMPEP_0181085166 /NCGR_PEP_ID=MMETSP1071-20121207/5089_1 /TAXON_ID=35127 /ORGANISM="Thalassiosira sp., Strain NH16" /LENGTH=192 /DNA_ID=CAMNT_0023166959 /DNA_START=312 /DNA_END=890 /DNA_ORIENTATION=+
MHDALSLPITAIHAMHHSSSSHGVLPLSSCEFRRSSSDDSLICGWHCLSSPPSNPTAKSGWQFSFLSLVRPAAASYAALARFMAPSLVSASPNGWSETPEGTSNDDIMIFTSRIVAPSIAEAASLISFLKTSSNTTLTASILQGFVEPTATLMISGLLLCVFMTRSMLGARRLCTQRCKPSDVNPSSADKDN